MFDDEFREVVIFRHTRSEFGIVRQHCWLPISMPVGKHEDWDILWLQFTSSIDTNSNDLHASQTG